MSDKASKPSVELGLAISGALLEPHQTRTRVELAAFCECTKQNIEQIENRALKKIRLFLEDHPSLRDEILSVFLSRN